MNVTKFTDVDKFWRDIIDDFEAVVSGLNDKIERKQGDAKVSVYRVGGVVRIDVKLEGG